MADTTQSQPVVPVPTTPPVTYFETPQMPEAPTIPEITAYQTPQITVPSTLYPAAVPAERPPEVVSGEVAEVQSTTGQVARQASTEPTPGATVGATVSTVATPSRVEENGPAGAAWVGTQSGVAIGLIVALIVVAFFRKRGG